MIAGIHAATIAVASTPTVTTSIAESSANPATTSAGASPFGELMNDALGKVGQLEDQARSAVEGLISGTGVDVHQAMIAAEKASMAFEMALAVRNKAVQSYQSVMSMQF